MRAEEENLEEEFVDEDEADNSAAMVKKLRERLKKATEEKQEYLDGWQRARADFANYKKEEAAREAHKEERLKVHLVEELLPVLDSLDLSILHADDLSKKGLLGIRQQFMSFLRQLGVEPIEAVDGQKLDHALHEPLREETVEDESQDQAIVRVHRAGYRLGERVIRPAQVTVGVLQNWEKHSEQGPTLLR